MGTQAFTFTPLTNGSDREIRWHVWMVLAKVVLFVRQLYAGTAFYSHYNCRAGMGSKGQIVVFNDVGHQRLGTIIYMCRTRLLYSPNGEAELF